MQPTFAQELMRARTRAAREKGDADARLVDQILEFVCAEVKQLQLLYSVCKVNCKSRTWILRQSVPVSWHSCIEQP